QRFERQCLEVGEAGEAGAEVVEAESASDVRESLREALRRVDIAVQGGLGDFEHEVSGIGVRVQNRPLDHGYEVEWADRLGRDVHVGSTPNGSNSYGLCDDPAVDFADHSVFLCGGYEASRKNDLAV